MVVDTQLGAPPESARIWPLVPAVVVARRLVPLPTKSVLGCISPQPVPPFETPRIPVMSVVRSTKAVATVPAVALRMPVRLARVKVLETVRLEVDAVFDTARFVVVALVEVLLVVVRSVMVDEALMSTPTVVVGVSAPPESSKAWPKDAPPPPPPEIQTPFTAKHPSVRLKPTLEVEVAEPSMVRPESVVVPKPLPAILRKLVAFDEDATWKTGFVCPADACTASVAYGLVVPIPTPPVV